MKSIEASFLFLKPEIESISFFLYVLVSVLESCWFLGK